MNLRVSLALLVLLVHAACCEERTIIFGISLGLNATESGDFGGAQQDTLEGLMVWKDWFNSLNASARTTSWGMTFKVDLHVAEDSKFADTPQNEQIMFDVYRDMALNSSIDYLFSPVASPWDIQARNYTYYVLGVPVMVGTPSTKASLYLLSASTPFEALLPSVILQIKSNLNPLSLLAPGTTGMGSFWRLFSAARLQ